MHTSFQTKEQADASRKWVLIDANDQVVGRLASTIAHILRGKNKPTYAPHSDCGDFVVVVNADKVRFTGQKEDQKLFRHHSGYIGGLKEISVQEVRDKRPERILERAVKGMLPKTALGRKMFTKLKVYTGDHHPHAAQMSQAKGN